VTFVPVIVLTAALVAPGAAAHDRPGNLWTENQAESITSIRGTPVRVRHCEGLGTARGRFLYRHFSCVAGTRLRYQPIDTVAVTYVLHPLGHYSGPNSRYALTNVRFIGHGVP
jgi:hypothetical protein